VVKAVGWLVIADKATRRQHTGEQNKETSFATDKEFGARVIMRALEKRYEIKYVSPKTINDYEYTFYSCVSWMDFYNLLFALKHIEVKTKLVIGGPGVLNAEHVKGKIFAAIIGRCDFDPQEIIDGTPKKNVIYLDKWQGEQVEIGQPAILSATETSCGCIKKCAFCEYGWRYKFLGKGKEYQSGPWIEDFIKTADFTKKRRIITGLDGLTAKERYCVNKSLTQEEFVETLLRSDEARDHVVLKLYSIVGFPFGDSHNQYDELRETISLAAARKKETLTVILYLSHFCPMPNTPMENERVSIKHYDRIAPEQHGKIKLMTYLQMTSYASAALECAMYRAQGEEVEAFRKSCLHDRFLSLGGLERIRIIDKYLPGIYSERENILPWLKRTNGLQKAKAAYKERVKESYGL
jgi:hypothetical protein